MSRKWYIAQTYSGQENSVKKDLERRIQSLGFQDKIYQILSPDEVYEDVKKVKVDGQTQEKKVQKTRKMFPGYIFVEMEVEKEVDEKTWFMVRNTPGVTGFLGSSGNGTKPNPVPQYEMDEILMKIGQLEKPVFDFKVGDKVEVTSGPWKNQVCEISAVNQEKNIVTVLIDMFGRLTPTELGFDEVKKL
jgi:transcriptional antiterminator NusG